MAQFNFDLTKIEASLQDQCVYLYFNLDIDEESINDADLFLVHKETKNIVPFDVEVDRKTICLRLKEWARPNEPYTLMAKSEIAAITGEVYHISFIRTFEFKSTITSLCKIISPSNHEVITNFNLVWTETSTQHPIIKLYYMEVATDTAFHNIVYRTNIDMRAETAISSFQKEFKTPLDEGQYFVRIRAQYEDYYGLWSDKVSFVIDSTPTKLSDLQDEPNSSELIAESDEGIIITDLTQEASPAKPILSTATDFYDPTPPYFDILSTVPIDLSTAVITVTKEGA